MYKLLLVSDKEEIRSLYRHYAEWNTLGFEQPAIAENALQTSRKTVGQAVADSTGRFTMKNNGTLTGFGEITAIAPTFR